MIKRFTFLFILLLAIAGAPAASAQEIVRYVKSVEKGGTDINGGTSWSDAVANIQYAISLIQTEITNNRATSGAVYVASGKYTPPSPPAATRANSTHRLSSPTT
ncbi:MAG: hypothetical protein LIO90_08095 [Bacteroidales bacterium]|nr:hypothetical protein [Bacteroidales bacterium]